MAHIANCIADVRPSAASNPPSAGLPFDSRTTPVTPAEKPPTWRMKPQPAPSQQKRYQFYPRERELPVLNNGSRPLVLEKASTWAITQKDDRTEKPSPASSLKAKISQHSIVRRRKVSVPDLGPMTTVQEVPLDSPTIPGHPPLHERSASAPADHHHHRPPGGSFFLEADGNDEDYLSEAVKDGPPPCSPKQFHPISPKQLAPLVIPQPPSKPPQLIPRRPVPHTRSGSVPRDISKASRNGGSPYTRTPYTPSTSLTDLSTPRTAVTNTASSVTLPTPISAPALDSHRFSPTPWEGRSTTPTMAGRSMTPQPVGSQRIATPVGHRRGVSESSNIMDRGRPRKRTDTSQINGPQPIRCDVSAAKSSERKAFEELPIGFRPKSVMASVGREEIAYLHKQAYGQAEHFEVLKKTDVEALSKELRRLDERTEYLRRTHASLRAGRRNLQSRICQFLRSPRMAKFSSESMLKQEEALAELDASIDDWVTKLEMAENRRTRVRQKLLEHVAAAAILAMPDATTAASKSLQQAVGIQGSPNVRDISTPPRSPTKQGTYSSTRTATSSPSPQRVVAQVPSTILENPIGEEAAAHDEGKLASRSVSMKHGGVESIRIYAGDDIATLLADVENEISRISQDMADPFTVQALSSPKRKEVHRQRSHELLSGFTSDQRPETPPKQDLHRPIPDSPPAPPPPIKDFPPRNPAPQGELLSRAVFKP